MTENTDYWVPVLENPALETLPRGGAGADGA